LIAATSTDRRKVAAGISHFIVSRLLYRGREEVIFQFDFYETSKEQQNGGFIPLQKRLFIETVCATLLGTPTVTSWYFKKCDTRVTDTTVVAVCKIRG